ncbi:MAG: choice-of-anchor tandem repeat GloVer-containing protein [Candidatus Cybelea sp.]
MRKLILFGAGILLASCARGGVAPLPATQTAQAFAPLIQPAADPSYRLLYSFKDGNDGGYPFAGLTSLNGELYGTTYGGGGPSGWGTVFKVGPTGGEKVIYKFKAGNDGAHPYGNLIALDGTLYGTTYQGGTGGGYGTVFKVTPAGEEHVLYSFNDGADGGYPYGSLVALGGMLYGTTYQGGTANGWGTVFKVSTSGDEHTLHKFAAGDDGAHPYAGLIVFKGALYGTTSEGGGPKGSGCLFKVSPAGDEHVVYGFKGGSSDGQYPYGPLAELNGAFFGTTYQGGISPGWGIVFKVTPAGKESVLHRFKSGDDGAHPYFGALKPVGGTLYGTTYQGGASGWGTVYSVTTSGSEHVLYGFKGGTDGGYPYDGLAELDGTLYGTTYEGGAKGFGTVFKLSP